MTRFLLSCLALAFLVVTLATGCGGSEPKKTDAPANVPPPPKDAPKGAVQMQ